MIDDLCHHEEETQCNVWTLTQAARLLGEQQHRLI
jgi:hypothetical protein